MRDDRNATAEWIDSLPTLEESVIQGVHDAAWLDGERAGFIDGCKWGRLSHFSWGFMAGALLVAAAFNFGAAP